MHKFTTTASVWLSPYSSLDAQSVQEATDITSMVIWPDDVPGSTGYVQIGTAELTVTIASPDTIIAGKVDSLRAELEII